MRVAQEKAGGVGREGKGRRPAEEEEVDGGGEDGEDGDDVLHAVQAEEAEGDHAEDEEIGDVEHELGRELPLQRSLFLLEAGRRESEGRDGTRMR